MSPEISERSFEEAIECGLLQHGRVSGEGPWLVPDAGAVFIHFIAERDVPIAGRHTVLVHRWHEPIPTADDLEMALAQAFPSRSVADALPG